MPTSSDLAVFGLILAGGSGTRLWPLSRRGLPKHLLPFQGKLSLLQQTASRLLKEIPSDRLMTITHEDHQFDVRRQLEAVAPDLGPRLLAEPQAKNTLPAITWGVSQIARKSPEAIVGVFPSDHMISSDAAFRKDLKKAFKLASQGYLVTFGIKPASPETGYGYIEAGQSLNHSGDLVVKAFREKPDRSKAIQYVRRGNFYWNSGIFVFRVSDFLSEISRLEPGILRDITQIVDSGNSPEVLREIYQRLKNISIDYGIMEKSKKVAVVPATFEWNDLGSWETIYQEGEKDKKGNVKEGDVLDLDTSSSLLISKKGFLGTIGLKDMVVVQTDDAVLVTPRNRSQEVKKIVDELKRRTSPLVETHLTVKRPWGTYTVLEEGLGYKIKRIVVNPSQKLSLQRHQHRTEHWVVIEGTARVINGTSEKILKPNESTFIGQGEKHRLENPGSAPLTIIEVQTGTYLGEDDIERFDDVYGRVSESRC